MIKLDAVTLAYGSRTALDVDHLSLDGPELVALIGPNGSGKTTLLRLLAGLASPTTGTIERSGIEVAYVSQRHDQHFWMPLTVGEVMRMGRYRTAGLLGRIGGADRRAMMAAAERLEVADLMGRSFGELSGGQRQRVLIATALVADAECLLLDEPISGLDLPSQQIITEIAAEERDKGRLVVMSTHHLDEATACDRVIVLATRVIADGPPDVVLRPEALAEAFGRRVLKLTDGDDASLDDGTIVLDDCATVDLVS